MITGELTLAADSNVAFIELVPMVFTAGSAKLFSIASW